MYSMPSHVTIRGVEARARRRRAAATARTTRMTRRVEPGVAGAGYAAGSMRVTIPDRPTRRDRALRERGFDFRGSFKEPRMRGLEGHFAEVGAARQEIDKGTRLHALHPIRRHAQVAFDDDVCDADLGEHLVEPSGVEVLLAPREDAVGEAVARAE